MKTLNRADHNARITNYFDQNYTFQRLMWTNSQSLALHFGYWEDNTRSDYEAQLNTNQQLARRAKLQQGQKVLDAGCGIGGSSVWMAENYDINVLGITISADQVRHATENAAKRGVSHLAKFSQQDYTNIDADSDTFDVVFALESASCAQSKLEFFSEAFRVLKPGGMFVLSDGFRYKRPFSAEDEALLQSFLWNWAIPDLTTPEEFISPMQQAGFEDVKFEDVSERAEPSMRRLYNIGRWSKPLAQLLGAVHLAKPIIVQCAVASYDQYIAHKRGLCGYCFLSARKPAK